jgi:PmbA protein
MKNSARDSAWAAVRGALARGTQGARAVLTRERESSVEWRDGKLDRLRESTSVGLNLSLFVDGRFSTHDTSDLRPEALGTFLDEAVAMTRLLETDPYRSLPDPRRYEGLFTGDLGLYDGPGSAAVTAPDRRAQAQALEDAARSSPGADRIISVTTNSSDSTWESALVNSNGMEGETRGTYFSLGCTTSVRDEENRRPRGGWYAAAHRRDRLPGPEPVAREATRRALLAVGAKPETSGRYPCVVENMTAGRLIRDLTGPLMGNAVQQQRSIFAGKIGQVVTSPVLTLRDEPHLAGGFGSGAYDDEGMATQARPVIERGVLHNYYLSVYYGAKLRMPATTAAPSNLVITLGERDLAGLLQAMGTGILITGFVGGNSNTATGDFSLGIRGQWIENGVPVRPLAEMNLAGNLLDTWSLLAETGSDPHPYSSVRVPSLRFDALQFSGT